MGTEDKRMRMAIYSHVAADTDGRLLENDADISL